MNVKRLKEIIKDMDDELEVFVRNTHNPVGNIGELVQAEKSSYGFFGESIPCLILNTYQSAVLNSQEELEEEEIPDFVESKA